MFDVRILSFLLFEFLIFQIDHFDFKTCKNILKLT